MTRMTRISTDFLVEKIGILHSEVYTFCKYPRVGLVSDSVTRQIEVSVSGYG